MTLEDLGYTNELEAFRVQNQLDSFDVGRVIAEHKDRYIVKTIDQEYESELLGSLRHTAESRYDLPSVGDWVAISSYDEDKALIHRLFPRFSVLERQALGKRGQVQIIATNIDYGLIIQAVDRDFNLNRLERYLTICNSSSVFPIIVLSKVDLINNEDLEKIKSQVNNRSGIISIVCVTNQSENGYDDLINIINRGKTYCLLGSSGVGKSTLLNALSGNQKMKTGHISHSVKKGRHITSHRELVVLNSGGILIDNPGMRELGMSDTSGGLEMTFEKILSISHHCKFKNCTHINEPGCTV